MECPRCGFQQPEEEYCAQCGVHILQARKRRRQRALIALLATVTIVAGGGVGLGLWLLKDRPVEAPPAPGSSETGEIIQRIESPPQRPGPPPPAKAAKKPAKAQHAAPPPPAPPKVPTESTPSPEPASPPPAEAKPVDLDSERQIRRWAAQEWLVKGREQAENMEQELAFYQKAVEVDAHFGPAHYYMAMVYWALGEKDASLEALRRFLRDATQEEREALPLPEGLAAEELGAPAGAPEGR